MLRNHTKIAWRNLRKNKTFSLINIAGLSLGMAVTMLIGLWLQDELTFSKNHDNYDRIVAVMQHQTFNGVKGTQLAVPYLLGDEIRDKYGSDFKYISMADWPISHILSHNNNGISKVGNFFEPVFPEMLSLKMLKGTRNGLKDPNSILLSASTAKAMFGDTDPMDQLIKLDGSVDVKVTGVYEDLPYNSSFREIAFMAPWELKLNRETWIREMENPWRSNFTQCYAQLADHADLEKVSTKIKDVKLHKVRAQDAAFKPEIFLHPMSKWHLYSDWENGKNIGGGIQFVWLFTIIGGFVLLLACINFMNLSTARSEKRAKEVGIRKAIGSIRHQLIVQFLSESLMVAGIAFIVALLLVQCSLPAFNDMATKRVSIPYTNPMFWLIALGITLITGLLAGSYPALYLSSFEPVKVLKGTFRGGRLAAIPRKTMVVIQFTVSVSLIIGTLVVIKQINFAQSRPTAYNREGLISFMANTPTLASNYEPFRQELLSSGTIVDMAGASSPTTGVMAINNGYTWKGMLPGTDGNFAAITVSQNFGKTIGWQILEGRDFSKDFASDSNGLILNETAAKFMGFKKPVGEIVMVDGHPRTVIGVVKDMVMESPYQKIFRTVFSLNDEQKNFITARLNPAKSTAQSLGEIEKVFKKYNPGVPFNYQFVDNNYADKFDAERRIAQLSSFFAILAIIISCLGLFGMATFMAEQRIKEVGVRKVLGASVLHLWGLMTKDFVKLVLIAFVLAVPIAYYAMHKWLLRYEYRTDIPWWLLVGTCAIALMIALITVSYQSIRAALVNPVKSLKSE
ncbi:MAG: ABC transporter permease [Chitinophaga sp.]|uniref:ABC transporter permease n=1 Tax=Chitinophaga sp. TaxID=1869181 RepID=UPI0025BED1C8|nr:ABC transporter permease [Chitinophaga sp.]MBV8254023.1 ABC transporter permease [Chitinophaga sp.]